MGFSVRNANDQSSFIESARGSFVYDSKSGYLGATNRTSVGKGGITILPFLDINGNGKRDPGEPKVAGLQIRINGGSIMRNNKDTIIHILDLIPYTSYFLELDKNSFDNVAWQMHNLIMKVNIDANQIKTIEIPVSVVAEAAGNVYNELKGQGRIMVCFYRSDGTLAARVMTESDGYYSYLGLVSGKYTARIDAEQLKKLKMVSIPEGIPVNIAPSREGTIVDGLDFRLSLINKEPVISAAQPVILKSPVDNPAMTAPAVKTTSASGAIMPVLIKAPAETNANPKAAVINQVPESATNQAPAIKKNLTSESQNAGNTAGPKKGAEIHRYGSVIQVGAFNKKRNAIKVKEDLLKSTDHPVGILLEEGLHKVQIWGFKGRKDALEYLPKLKRRGFIEAFVVRIE